MESPQAGSVPGKRSVQGQASGADGGETGGASLRAVASGEQPGQGRADYRRGVEAIEMEGGGSQSTSEDSRGQASDGRAVEARDDLNDTANRPTAAHGKLEKPEQQG